MEVIRALLRRSPAARAVVLTAAPEAIFRDYLAADPAVLSRVEIAPWRADVGIVQRDGLAMDREATLAALAAAWADPGRAEEALASRLAPLSPAIVLGDIPPVAFGAAARLGVPSVAVGNFDWASIYGAYAEKDEAFAPWANLCLRWQAQATAAVHLEPGPPLTGFARAVEAAPVARTLHADAAAVRASLGIPDGDRAVLASFGGFGLADAGRRIPKVPGVTWVLAPPMDPLDRPDARFSSSVPYLALLAACDAVFTKPGYGIVCEATRHHTRLLYTDRGDFPEYPWLVRWLEASAPAAHVASAALGTPGGAEAVRAALERLFALPDRWPSSFGGADQVADVALGLARV
jgi:hypothetical protein